MQMKLCWHSMLAHQCLPLPVRVSEYRQPFSCAYCDFTKLIHIESSKWYGISYLRLHPCRLPLRQETRQVPTLTVQHRGRLPRQRLRLEGALPGLSPIASPRQVPATQQEDCAGRIYGRDAEEEENFTAGLSVTLSPLPVCLLFVRCCGNPAEMT